MTQPYSERFPVGTRVRIKSSDDLAHFRETWRFHNPLLSSQLDYAGLVTVVREVGFYHGGDVLYSLEDAPGVWHEAVLDPCDPE